MHVYLCRLYAIIKIQNLTWKVFFMIQFKYEDIHTTSVYTTLYYQCYQKYYLVYIYYYINLLAKFVKVFQFYSVIFIYTCTCEAYRLQTLMNKSIPDIPSINPLYLTICVYNTLKIPKQQKNTHIYIYIKEIIKKRTKRIFHNILELTFSLLLQIFRYNVYKCIYIYIYISITQ